MSYGSDPYEAGQREALRATDALLDRIGSRVPTPEDLDDPLVAALALMAAEIDLDAVPVEVTRAAVERDLAGLRLAGPQVRSATGRRRRRAHRPRARPPRRAGLHGEHRVAPAPGGETPAPGPPAARPLPSPRRGRCRVRAAGPGARSRGPASAAPEPRGSVRRGDRGARAGLGVSAAVTGGRSVNPLTGLQQVVAQLTGGRTAEQQDLYARANHELDQAQAALDQGDRAAARNWVKQYDALKRTVLTDEDKNALEKRRASIQAATRPLTRRGSAGAPDGARRARLASMT